MHHQWVFDVLDDLRRFARMNGLDDLSHQLDLTLAAATSDVARLSGGPVLTFSRAGPMPSGEEGIGRE